MYELSPLVMTPPNLRVIPPCVDTIKFTSYRPLCGTTTLHVNAITMQMYEFQPLSFYHQMYELLPLCCHHQMSELLSL